MYVQDENQMIRGNLDIPGKWDERYDTSQMWTTVLILPQIGAFVTYQGESYVIISTLTYQEESADSSTFQPKSVISTICTILPITEEGEDAGKPTIKVKADELELI